MKRVKHRISEGALLMKEVRRFRRFYRLQIVCDIFNGGILLTIILVFSVFIYKLTVSPVSIPPWTFLVPLLLSVIFAFIIPIRTMELAAEIDRKMSLKERLLTSLYFLSDKGAFSCCLFRDTLVRMKKFEPRALFPLKWSRTVLLFAVLAAALLLYSSYIPVQKESLPVPHVSDDARLVMQKEGVQIKQFADMMESSESFTGAEEKILIQQLRDLGENLESGKFERRDAFLMLEDLSSSIKDRVKGKADDSDRHGVNDSQRFESNPAGTKENIVQDILDSLSLAKRHIAETGLSLHAEPDKQGVNRNSGATPSAEGKSISQGGRGTHPLSPGKAFPEAGISSEGAPSVAGSEIMPLQQEKIASTGDIPRYSDSAIPLESLPGNYREIVIKYFDAISKDQRPH